MQMLIYANVCCVSWDRHANVQSCEQQQLWIYRVFTAVCLSVCVCVCVCVCVFEGTTEERWRKRE